MSPVRQEPEPSIQQILERLERVEKEVGTLRKIQFGVAELNYPGGSQEATTVQIKLEKELPPAPANTFLLTIFASGVKSLPFIGSVGTTLTQLEIGCITTDGTLPVAGTKQRVFWAILSSG